MKTEKTTVTKETVTTDVAPPTMAGPEPLPAESLAALEKIKAARVEAEKAKAKEATIPDAKQEKKPAKPRKSKKTSPAKPVLLEKIGGSSTSALKGTIDLDPADIEIEAAAKQPTKKEDKTKTTKRKEQAVAMKKKSDPVITMTAEQLKNEIKTSVEAALAAEKAASEPAKTTTTRTKTTEKRSSDKTDPYPTPETSTTSGGGSGKGGLFKNFRFNSKSVNWLWVLLLILALAAVTFGFLNYGLPWIKKYAGGFNPPTMNEHTAKNAVETPKGDLSSSVETTDGVIIAKSAKSLPQGNNNVYIIGDHHSFSNARFDMSGGGPIVDNKAIAKGGKEWKLNYKIRTFRIPYDASYEAPGTAVKAYKIPLVTTLKPGEIIRCVMDKTKWGLYAKVEGKYICQELDGKSVGDGEVAINTPANEIEFYVRATHNQDVPIELIPYNRAFGAFDPKSF